MLFFVWSHGLDDGLRRLERVVWNINVFQCLVHTGKHTCEILHVTHFLNLLELVIEIVNSKLVTCNLLMQFPSLFLIELLLCLLYQRYHISHTQDTVRHTGGIKNVESFHLFTGAHEFDGLAGNCLDGQGGTAPGITVHLGKHHSIVIYCLVESLGTFHRILPCHGINHEQALVGIQRGVQQGDFIHQFLVHDKPAGGIYHHYIVTLGTGKLNSIPRNFYRVFLPFFAIYGNADLPSKRFQLVDGSRTKSIARGKQHLTAFLAL